MATIALTSTFTPLSSLVGGLLIGLASAGLLLFHGRIAGISGILGGALERRAGDIGWRVSFLVGLIATGAVWSALFPEAYAVTIVRSPLALGVAGVLVGVGTRIGNGCTSGHGVCGLGRLSRRSLVATLTFMATAALTVFLTHLLLGSVRGAS